MQLILPHSWGERPSGFRRYNYNWKVSKASGPNPKDAWLGLGTQPRYETPGELRVKIDKKRND